ncbi:hypothetical protein [Paraburkholderia silvatlantica]|uniref:DUF7946 domain-containing protein n=1 Tax=Paraburkholderia silvatlantica TaxID=321895 RepID=UPI0010615B60|nr:hypothetical protein [Paraburkholderia silvatlantica]TDQ73651.1 hypothetical protein C7412_14533 [Paraburkholderia silvatlantica]
MSEKELSLIIRIEGGTADEGVLDVYDAANTIYGVARAINLVAHAFANDDEVRKKNSSAHGASVFIHSSKKGCFEEQLDIKFDEHVAEKIGASVIVNNFWDYLTWTWSHSVGIEYEPRMPRIKKISERNDLFIHEIADALESPMQYMHKSIARDKTVKIYVNRPRVGDELAFDSDTLDYVSVREEQTDTEYITGNVTRVNVLSQFGRLYSDVEGRVISFELKNPDDRRVRGLSLKSMQDHNEGKPGKVYLKVSKIVSAQGVVKRYIVHDILEII